MPAEFQSALNLRGMVNGQPTEIFPAGELYRFPNNIDGTQNAIELAGSGFDQSAYLEDLAMGVPLVPEDLQMYIGARDLGAAAVVDPARQRLADMIANPRTPDNARREYQDMLRQMEALEQSRAARNFEREGGNGEGVYVLALQRSSIGEGEVDPDSLSADDIFSVADELGAAFGIFWDDLHSVYTSMGGIVGRAIVSQAYRFETTFRGVNELVGRQLSLADQIRMRRIFLREIFSARPARVTRHRGQKLISFRGAAGNRVFLSRTAFPANTMAVLDANIVANNNSAAIRRAAGGPFRGAGGFFLIVGGVVEVVHWLTLPESERYLGDLIANLGITVAIGVFSGVAATAGVLLGLAAAGVAAPVVVTGLAIGAVAVGIGLLASWALDATGARHALQQAGRRFVESLRAFTAQVFPPPQQIFYDPDWHPIQNMGVVEGINYINNAPPEEAQYIMERMFGVD